MSDIKARAGSKHGKRGRNLDVAKVIIHAGYQSEKDPKPHDIALMVLSAPVALGARMNAICLPRESTKDKGVTVYSAGWGHERTKTSCLTNQKGPRLFEKCVGEECNTRAPPPSSPACKQFFNAVEINVSRPSRPPYCSSIAGEATDEHRRLPGRQGEVLST